MLVGTSQDCGDMALGAQDFSRDPPRTGDRAVDRRVLAIRFRGFPGEENRRLERRPQLLPRAAATNRGIAVRAAREGIGLPVVTESATESLVQPYRVHPKDYTQRVERDPDALRIAEPSERPRVGTRGPARNNGKRRRAAHPPYRKRRIAGEQETVS